MAEEILNPNHFYEGSFADEKVSNALFDMKNKKIIFFINGCESDDSNGNQIFYKDLKLQIRDWWDIKIYKNDINLGKEVLISLDNLEALDEILIYNISDNCLTIEGYGKLTNQWIKFIFTKPRIDLSGIKCNA